MDVQPNQSTQGAQVATNTGASSSSNGKRKAGEALLSSGENQDQPEDTEIIAMTRKGTEKRLRP